MQGLTRLQAAWLFSLTLLGPAVGLAQTPGPIVAVGGGSIGDDIYARTLALGGGPRAQPVVVRRAVASVAAGKTATADGLALWPEVIVDQHFL